MAARLLVAFLLLALLNACAAQRVVRLDTGQGTPLEYRPPTSADSVNVDAEAFEDALSHLVLNAPLSLRPPQHGWLMIVSSRGNDVAPHRPCCMSQRYSGLCEPCQHKETCLSPLDDVMGLNEWDKLGVALGLSIEPLEESIARAVEKTLAPQLVYAVIATGLVTWAVLAANPEPVFTKAAAIVSALLLIYLGVETFLEVVDASRELKWASDRAMSWEELEQASKRFAHQVGPEVARVFVLAVTVAVSYGMAGGSAWLASRLGMLPHFAEAAALGASTPAPQSLGDRLGARGGCLRRGHPHHCPSAHGGGDERPGARWWLDARAAQDVQVWRQCERRREGCAKLGEG